MPERRIVMRVEVIWITEDPNTSVEFAFRQYDETGMPSPVDFVAMAMKAAAETVDWSIAIGDRTDIGGRGFEMRVDGPEKWSVAFDGEAEDTGAGVARNGPADGDAGVYPRR